MDVSIGSILSLFNRCARFKMLWFYFGTFLKIIKPNVVTYYNDIGI